MPEPNTRQILDVASRYVILKTAHGITVGLHINDVHYGEAHSDGNDLDAAVHQAYDNAKAHKRRGKKRN